MMKSPQLRSTPALIIAASALILSATGGAVAADLITGADIKDGTVTTKDVKDETLTLRDIGPGAEDALQGAAGPAGTDGVSGWTSVTVLSDVIAAGASGSVVVDCPGGTNVTGGIVDWSEGYDPVSMRARSDSSVRAYGQNATGVADTLVATIYCAKVS